MRNVSYTLRWNIQKNIYHSHAVVDCVLEYFDEWRNEFNTPIIGCVVKVGNQWEKYWTDIRIVFIILLLSELYETKIFLYIMDNYYPKYRKRAGLIVLLPS